MKKYKIPLLTIVALLLLSMFTTQSCRKISDFKNIDSLMNEEFYEIANRSDEITIDGSVAVPLINSTFKLSDFIPELDSSFWVEIDPSTNPDDEYYQLMHMRMYFKDVAVLEGSNIYDGLFPAGQGTVIPANKLELRTDTSKLKLYEKALSGKLFFYDPKVTFKFKNEIPIVTSFNLDSIIFHNQFLEPISATPEINHTINSPTSAGTEATTDIEINKNNLPILPEIFSPIPKFLSFFVSIGSDTDQELLYNLTGNEKISMDVDVDVPMKARLEDFEMGDTIDYDFGNDTLNREEIKSVTIKLMMDNFIPAGGVAKIRFYDVNNEGIIVPGQEPIIDLMDEATGEPFSFTSAITDQNGYPTSSQKSDFVIHLTQEQLAELKLKNATKIVVTGVFNSYQSSDDQYVKIFSWCTLGIKLGIKVDYEASTGDIPQ